MYYLKSRNELGEIEDGIGDGEVYEYTTIEEFLDDNSRMGIDIKDGIHILMNENVEVSTTELEAATAEYKETPGIDL